MVFFDVDSMLIDVDQLMDVRFGSVDQCLAYYFHIFIFSNLTELT